MVAFAGGRKLEAILPKTVFFAGDKYLGQNLHNNSV